jgi:hypothetical protein
VLHQLPTWPSLSQSLDSPVDLPQLLRSPSPSPATNVYVLEAICAKLSPVVPSDAAATFRGAFAAAGGVRTVAGFLESCLGEQGPVNAGGVRAGVRVLAAVADLLDDQELDGVIALVRRVATGG